MALILLIAAGAGWAWWTGRLKNLTFDDAAAAAALLLGVRLATTGKLFIGLPLIAAAILWGIYRRTRKIPAVPMPVKDARALLGVSRDASPEEVKDAHRRLIAKVHPDTGGSAELANRVNVARDTILEELNRDRPRAS